MFCLGWAGEGQIQITLLWSLMTAKNKQITHNILATGGEIRDTKPQLQQICYVTRSESGEKRATKPKFVVQSRLVLYFEQQISSTRNKCFVQQVDHAR